MTNAKAPDIFNFSVRLRMARKKAGMTAEKLAKLSGVCMTSIYLYEEGRRYPNIFSATLIASALGVSLDWLAGKKD